MLEKNAYIVYEWKYWILQFRRCKRHLILFKNTPFSHIFVRLFFLAAKLTKQTVLGKIHWEKNETAKNTFTKMKFSFPMPAGGTGIALFSKLVRTKDLRTVQGEDPRSTKPKLTVSYENNLIRFDSVLKKTFDCPL